MAQTTVPMNKEDQLIARIQKRLGSRSIAADRAAGLALGPGDDACVLRTTRGWEWATSSDSFIEGVHFNRRLHPAVSIGYKALARATSDLAAMGATPRCYLMGLALPGSLTGRWLDEFLNGMARSARKLGMVVAGGDTSRADAIAANLTVLGEVRSGQAIVRSGAKPGDRVFVTGHLGAAQLGLEILLRGISSQASLRRYLTRHLYPDPPVEFGQWLARRKLPSAMMDLSDGLSTDLDRLCRSSGVGARIYETKLPAVRVPKTFRRPSVDALNLALDGGEDYQFLFTAPARAAKRIPRIHHGVRITEIGEIVRGSDVLLISANGSSSPLIPRGWDHFGPASARRKSASKVPRT